MQIVAKNRSFFRHDFIFLLSFYLNSRLSDLQRIYLASLHSLIKPVCLALTLVYHLWVPLQCPTLGSHSKVRPQRLIFLRLLNLIECVSLEKVGNFRDFQVFDSGSYTEIENFENSQIFSRLVNFKECVLFEEVGNFRGFQVFDFGPYTEIKNSENSEIFPRSIFQRTCFT